MQVLVPYPVTGAVLAASNVPEADYAAWAAGTAYALGQRVIRTSTHRVYERLVAGGGSVVPEADEVAWLDVGATNRWAMFDQAVGSVSSLPAGPLTVQLAIPGPVNDLVLLGVTGSTVTVTLPGITRTVAVPAPLVAGEGSTVLFEGLASASGDLQVSIAGPGGVAVGTLAAGVFVGVGDSAQGLQIGNLDYSTKDFDAFGRPKVTRRGASRRVTVPLTMPVAAMDQASRVLTALRSQPVIWRGVPWLGATLVYGFARDWSLQHDGGIATGSVSLIGLAFGYV